MHKHSNHSPILLTTDLPSKKINGVKPFRFDDHWIWYDTCKNVVKLNWLSRPAVDIPNMTSKIDDCGKALASLASVEVGGLRSQIASCENKLISFSLKCFSIG